MPVIAIEVWSRSYNKDGIQTMRTLTKYSNGTYLVANMSKDSSLMNPLWSLPIGEQVSGFISEAWDYHRMYDTMQSDWVDVYP